MTLPFAQKSRNLPGTTKARDSTTRLTTLGACLSCTKKFQPRVVADCPLMEHRSEKFRERIVTSESRTLEMKDYPAAYEIVVLAAFPGIHI